MCAAESLKISNDEIHAKDDEHSLLCFINASEVHHKNSVSIFYNMNGIFFTMKFFLLYNIIYLTD